MSVKSVYNQQVMPADGNLMNLFALLLHLVPKNLVSYITGAIVRIRWPMPMGPWVVSRFAEMFKLDLSEAEYQLSAYATIEELFTRRLKTGARTWVGPVASPADGQLARSQPATDGICVQAKGLNYRLDELVFGPGGSSPTPLGWQQTVYLAPHNYHRVHAPFAGKITAIRYVPGELWPVNVPFVLRTPRLFARNERLVFDFEPDFGGKAYVVMVGALNVGRIVTPLMPELVTNALSRQLGSGLAEHRFSSPLEISIGQELGTFMLGSTVVIAYDNTALERINLVPNEENRPILVGQPLTIE